MEKVEKIKTFIYLAKLGKTYKEISEILETPQQTLENWNLALKKQGLIIKVRRNSKAKEIFDEIAYAYSKNSLSQPRTEDL